MGWRRLGTGRANCGRQQSKGAIRSRNGIKTAAAFLPMHVHPKIGNLRVDGFTERDVTAALSPVWHTKPALAKKLRHCIGLVLDFSKASGWRNEAAPRQSLSALLSKQQEGGNFPSMPYEELPAFVAKVEGRRKRLGGRRCCSRRAPRR